MCHGLTHQLYIFTTSMNIHYKNKILSPAERAETISRIDQLVSQYEESIKEYRAYKDYLLKGNEPSKELHELMITVCSAAEFTIRTIADCTIMQKFFLTSDKDYDKRFARGKLMVILNEGFKKVYGFNPNGKNQKKEPSIWVQISKFVSIFPEPLKHKHLALQTSLEAYAKDSWWKNERNYETHLDIDGLYKSRNEEIIEGKTIMESTELITILLRVHDFIKELHIVYCNTLMERFRQQIYNNR